MIWMLITALFVIVLLMVRRKIKTHGTPPGSLGWPLMGETMDLLKWNKMGKPEEFWKERSRKYGDVFRTSILGHPTVAFCGAQGNRFVLGNENKLVAMWMPPAAKVAFGNSIVNKVGDEAKNTKKALTSFFRHDNLKVMVGKIDAITRSHLANLWHGNAQVKAAGLVRKCSFSIACSLFLSLDYEVEQKEFSMSFRSLMNGLVGIPIGIPGTSYRTALSRHKKIRQVVLAMLRERRSSPSTKGDLISHLMAYVDEDGKHLTDQAICDNVIHFLFVGDDTTSCALTVLIKLLGHNHHVYLRILQEQQEIASSKEENECLQWEDLCKMKYTSKAIQETLRLHNPAFGMFREAIQEFSYGGYIIPKGWKVYCSAYSSHKNEEYFKDVERFNPDRFDGEGPARYTFIPFGGGARMCPGMEYARMEILVFIHYLVTKYSWELVDPSESITVDPVPTPVNGLPIFLIPHLTP